MVSSVMKLRLPIYTAILVMIPAVAAAQVSVDVRIKPNLADAATPMPELNVFNHTKQVIELEVFHGVAFTHLESKTKAGFVRGQGAICGNGFHPRRLPPGRYEAFPLWSLLGHGPGKSGSYRIALPYVMIKGKKRVSKEALTKPFKIRYGDIRPGTWARKNRPQAIAIIGLETQVVGRKNTQSHPAARLAKLFLPGIKACVKTTRKTLPWIRGRFTLNAYRYSSGKRPTTFVGTSLLGNARLNACIAAIPAPPQLLGSYKLTYVVPQPLP